MPVVSVFCYPQNNILHSTCSTPKSCQLATSRWTWWSTEQQKPFDHLTSICHVRVGRIVCCDGQKKSAALLAVHFKHHSVTRCAAVWTTLDFLILLFLFFFFYHAAVQQLAVCMNSVKCYCTAAYFHTGNESTQESKIIISINLWGVLWS